MTGYRHLTGVNAILMDITFVGESIRWLLGNMASQWSLFIAIPAASLRRGY